MSRNLLLGIVLAAAAAVGLLALQLSPSAEPAGRDATRTLTIASIAYPLNGKSAYSGLSEIVIRDGWLERALAARGVKLAWFPVPTSVGGPLINESFAATRIDFASYGDLPAIIANAGGVETSIVVPSGRGQNSYLIVRNDVPARSIKDLKGKRIALHRGRPWELSFSRLIDANGLTMSDFRIFNLNPQASAAALASGDVDALFTLSDALVLEDKGVGHVIWSTKQAPADWRMRAELWGRRDFIRDNPELTQLVATAFVRAAHWSTLSENRDEVLRLSARSGTPVSVVARDLDDPRVDWRARFSPLFDAFMKDHYRYVADYSHATGIVRRRVDVDPLFEPRFVDQALKELKLEDYWRPANTDAVTGAAQVTVR